MIRNVIKKIIKDAIGALQKEKVFCKFDIPEILIESPIEKIYGDYATNIAMVIVKQVKKNPMEIGEDLKSQILNLKSDLFEKIEIVNPGFLNFFLSKQYLQKQIAEILKQKENFGDLKIGKKKKINIEFISANPTGPLTLGNGRGGFYGDVLSSVLTKAGYKVEREYFINNVGEQIRRLGCSVIGNSEALYQGKYIKKLSKRIKEKDEMKAGEKAANIILKEMIKPAIKKIGIKFDNWFSEESLYKDKKIDKILKFLKKKKLIYERDGALWFRSSKFNDDKDRVLIRKNGEKTYFASDIAYLKDKFQRGFDSLIYIWGADHHGYIKRMQAAAQSLGYKKEQVIFIIMQLVKLFEKRKEVRMSKRTGIYVSLEELINEISLDVARFFFLQKSAGSHLNFDLDLAKEQSEKNPIYYIQYAYARICSILRKCGKSEIQNPKSENLKLLNHPSELQLIKQLVRLPEVIEDTARDYQIQRLPQYVIDLATVFHQFYRDCKVLTGGRPLQEARLALVLATKIVLKNTLNLMGISAPQKM